jgi:hypothetical protein
VNFTGIPRFLAPVNTGQQTAAARVVEGFDAERHPKASSAESRRTIGE